MSDQDAAFDSQLAAALGKAPELPADPPAETEKPAAQPEKADDKPAEPAEEPETRITDKDRAIALGWNPDKDDYEAKTGREWVSAGAFLRFREMADEISRSHKSEKQLRREMDELRKQINKDLGEIQNERKQRSVESIEAQILQAAQDQDLDTLRSLIQKRDEIFSPVQEEQQHDEEEKPLYNEEPEYVKAAADAWMNQNPWFKKATADIRQEAAQIERDFLKKYPGSTVEKTLRFVALEMEDRHPELRAYSKPLASPDASPRKADRPVAKGYTASDLPQADRDIFNRLVARGHFKTEADKQRFIKETLGA